MQSRKIAGFTLIELMVSITIMGILAAIVTANFTNSRAKARDLERQADLRELQAAIENYKRDNGRYPEMGCGMTITSVNSKSTLINGVSTQENCADYIKDLAPKYIIRLPKDPSIGSGFGYGYATNALGTVYKVMAVNTVESEMVNYNHPFRSCDIRNSSDGLAYPAGSNISSIGWCAIANYGDPRTGGAIPGSRVPDCIRGGQTTNSITGNGRFDKTYGVWGGFDMSTTTITTTNVRPTAQVICE